MNKIELKTCPFCGGKAELKQDIRYPKSGEYAGESVKAYEIICPNYDCAIYNADNTYFLSEEDAVKAWNTRQSEWISAEDKLPEMFGKYETVSVLATDGYEMFVAWYNYFYKKWESEEELYNHVTHWMYLPEPPEYAD